MASSRAASSAAGGREATSRAGLAEVTVLVRRCGRVVPVAMQLDGAKGRWELVELQY
jgi:hypothetical protein